MGALDIFAAILLLLGGCPMCPYTFKENSTVQVTPLHTEVHNSALLLWPLCGQRFSPCRQTPPALWINFTAKQKMHPVLATIYSGKFHSPQLMTTVATLSCYTQCRHSIETPQIHNLLLVAVGNCSMYHRDDQARASTCSA